MTLVYLVGIASFLALTCIVLLIYSRGVDAANAGSLTQQLRSINVNALMNLLDSREEEYLRSRLSSRQFRKVHRERMFAAMEYVWHVAQNARVLARFAEGGVRDANHEVATAAERLWQEAIVLRLSALQMLPYLCYSALCYSALFAGGRSLPDTVVSHYDLAASQFTSFARLQQVAGPVQAA